MSMYIAQGMYRFSSPSEAKLDALFQLVKFTVFPINQSIEVTLTFDGYNPSKYLYSMEFTMQEAVEDAILSNYRKFNIKLYQEI